MHRTHPTPLPAAPRGDANADFWQEAWAGDGMAWRFPPALDVPGWRADAEHWLQTGATPAVGTAAPLQPLAWAWALRQADSRLAAALAQRWLQRPSTHPAPPAADPAALATAWLVLAEAAWLAGEPQGARAHLDRAGEHIGQGAPTRAQSDLHWLQSLLAAEAGDPAQCNAALAAALTTAQAVGDALRTAYGELAIDCVAVMAERGRDAPDRSARARAQAEAADAGLRMLANLLLQHQCSQRQDARGAIAHGERARSAALACGQWRRAVLTGCNIGLDLYDQQALDEALGCLEGVLPLARQCGWPLPLATVLQATAQCLVALERPAAALELAQEALALVERQPFSRTRLLALVAQGDALLALPGREADAERAYRTLELAARAADDEAVLRSADYGLARLHEQRGLVDQACSHAQACLERSLGCSDVAQAVLSLRLLARLARREQAASSEPAATALLERANALLTEGAAEPAGAAIQHGLLAELATAYAATDPARAAATWAAAYEALKAQRSDELTRRAALLEVRLRTEAALERARLDRERAEAEQRKAAELDAVNRQLAATLQALQDTQQELVARNDALSRAYSSLNELSLTDPLTQLHNRRFFDSVIERCAGEALASWLAPDAGPQDPARRDLLFLMLDLDHFKAINDSHGHAAGDAVLVQLGERLRAVARAQDHVVRWGGEEFLLLLRSASRRDGPLIAQRLLDAVAARPFDLPNGLRLAATCSIGWCAYPPDPVHPQRGHWQDTLQRADNHLYEAKRRGRNRAVG